LISLAVVVPTNVGFFTPVNCILSLVNSGTTAFDWRVTIFEPMTQFSRYVVSSITQMALGEDESI